ncbi:MAG: hypothetical protein ACYTG4_15570, partial [Planctomycetota bacterium]|jgi:hypothetical protein
VPSEIIADIELEKAKTVTVKTKLPKGASYGNAAILVDKAVMMDGHWDEDRRVHVITGVPEGTWAVVAYLNHDGQYHAGTVTVEAGGTCEIDLSTSND